MRCLCCNKVISSEASNYEKKVCWHNTCIKSFFGTTTLPTFKVNANTLNTLAKKSAKKGFSIPGVQKKLLLHLEKENAPTLMQIKLPNGYILKPQTEEFENLPEAEFLAMTMAKAVGIRTVPFALIKTNETYTYITKRIDRIFEKNDEVKKLAMEDFCQLDGRLTIDKYKGSYERCGKIISRYSSRVGFDLSEFYMRLVFSFIIGNSDMHLKNFSLIETAEATFEYVLSDAYDLLPVNVIMPDDKEQVALTLNGKKKNIRKKDFFNLAENIGINKKIAEKTILNLIVKEKMFYDMCDESYLPNKLKESLKKLISERIEILK